VPFAVPPEPPHPVPSMSRFRDVPSL
jgi:hypothetical protein